MILEFIGKEKISKNHLKTATALLPSDISLPLEVREYLTGPNADIIFGGES